VLRLLLAAVFACVSPFALAQGESAKTPADATAERPIAGKVVLVEGDVRVYDRNQGLRRPKLDDSCTRANSIVTGDGGEVHFNMEDGGYIGVRPNTQMRISPIQGGRRAGRPVGDLPAARLVPLDYRLDRQAGRQAIIESLPAP